MVSSNAPHNDRTRSLNRSDSTSALSDGGDSESDLLNDVIMAVDATKKGNIGCCYFSAQEQQLSLMCDVQNGSLDILDSCKLCSAVSLAYVSMISS